MKKYYITQGKEMEVPSKLLLLGLLESVQYREISHITTTA